MSNQTPINPDVKTQSTLCERCRWVKVMRRDRCDWCGKDLTQWELVPETFLLRRITVDSVHGEQEARGMENTLRNYLHRVSDYMSDDLLGPVHPLEIFKALWICLWNRQDYND